MSLAESAPIVQKAYDLSLWLLPKVERFSRTYRFTIGDRITTTMLDLLTALVEAAYSARREAPLDRAIRDLNCLRFLMRLSKDLNLLSVESYGFAAGLIEELGRMAGGWRKASVTR